MNNIAHSVAHATVRAGRIGIHRSDDPLAKRLAVTERGGGQASVPPNYNAAQGG
jgi:hypothetical protein